MNRLNIKDPINRAILDCVRDGHKSVQQVINELGYQQKPTIIRNRIERMVKAGYINKQKVGIVTELVLAPNIQNVLPLVWSNETCNSNTNPVRPLRHKRLHKLGLYYPFKEPLPAGEQERLFKEQAEIPAKITNLTNNQQATLKVGITIRITSKGMLLYAPELYYYEGQPSIVAESIAKDILDKYALEYEQRLNNMGLHFSLMRIKKDVLYSIISSQEIADEKNPITEIMPEGQHKMVLARSPVDNKERLIIDSSKKTFAELETVHSKSADVDMDTVDRQFNAVLDGEINLLELKDIQDYKELTKQSVELQHQITEQQALFGKNLESHANAIKELSEAVKRLNEWLDAHK